MSALTETALAVVRQFLLFGALLTPLQLLVPARREQGLVRRGTWTDLAYFALSPFAISAGASLLLAGIAVALGWLVPQPVRAALAGQPAAVQLAEIFVLAEVGGYWTHRLSHRVLWLWRFHAIHHSTTEMDWLAAHRQHPLEAIWLLGVANLPALLLGFSLEPLAWFVLAQKVYTAFLHANVRIGFGRLGLLLASPQFHHLHHDRDAGPDARNFASLLPILDWLWGSYATQDGRFPARYGIDEPMPQSYPGQLAQPFRPLGPR